MTTQLNSNFLNELFKLCLRKRQVFDLAKAHIKYNYLPSEQHKEVWKMMVDYYETSDKLLSIGALSQSFQSQPKVLQIINEVASAELPDEETMIDQLELFVKNKIFIDTYDQLADLFNRNQKDKVFDLFSQTADILSKFRIRDSREFTKIYQGFAERYKLRLLKKSTQDASIKQKIPTGIVPLDNAMRGGIDRQDTFLGMAPSGVGKSKMLKFMGAYASRLGFRVVHIQVEGSEQEAVDAYDAALADKPLYEIEYALLKQEDINIVNHSINQITQTGGEIYLKAFEQFDSATMKDVHAYCQEIVDKIGPIDLLLLDYLDEIDPGDGKKYSTSNDGERKRREATAKKFKNICVEFNCAGATMTQSSTLPPAQMEDPAFVLTRFHISEFKGVIKPFSYFVTVNQTPDEKNVEIIRLYFDKFRKYKANNKVRSIGTNYNREKFYDHQKTILKFGNQVEEDVT